jgi:long-chain acyl-CoA synthetase
MRWPSIPEYLAEKASKYKTASFLKDYDSEASYTYADFDAVTSRLADGFRKLGLSPGDRIAFLHENHTDLILGYFSVIKAGGVAVIISPAYTTREICNILQDSGARILISNYSFIQNIQVLKTELPDSMLYIIKANGQTLEETLNSLAEPLRQAEPVLSDGKDLAMIFYTSGTTGQPKGVMINHKNVIFGASNIAQSYGLTSSDITLLSLPLNHIFANASPLWGSLSSGGCVIVMNRFQTASVFDAIDKHRISWFPGVPTMFSYLLSDFSDNDRDVSSLRMGVSGAASLSEIDLADFEDKFEATMLEVYGLTESTGLVTANPVYGIRKPRSIGISVSGVSVRIVDGEFNEVASGDVGEIIFKGANASPGYWRMTQGPEKAMTDDWISTGDLAFQDQDGYFFITSRKDELIVSGGYNIYPREIEDVLRSHPGVTEAAVIGISDQDLGEVPKAFVVLKKNFQMKDSELLKFSEKYLAKYKLPKIIEFKRDLPRSSTGKIVKRFLLKNDGK